MENEIPQQARETENLKFIKTLFFKPFSTRFFVCWDLQQINRHIRVDFVFHSCFILSAATFTQSESYLVCYVSHRVQYVSYSVWSVSYSVWSQLVYILSYLIHTMFYLVYTVFYFVQSVSTNLSYLKYRPIPAPLVYIFVLLTSRFKYKLKSVDVVLHLLQFLFRSKNVSGGCLLTK